MNKKYFVLNDGKESLSKDEISEIEARKQAILNKVGEQRRLKSSDVISQDPALKHTYGRVVVKVDIEYKNHTMLNGSSIRLERGYNNFNKRETQPVNAIVISADNIPSGSEILISHNCTHDTNKIFNYAKLSGQENDVDIQYFSLPEADCFAWRGEDGKFHPMRNFEFGLRVFEPYKGMLSGIDPTVVKNIMYITTGELSGMVVHTVLAADYQIVFQDNNGKENNLIRIRHFQGEKINEREEIMAISHSLTEKVNNGELLVGLTISDCKTLKEYNG